MNLSSLIPRGWSLTEIESTETMRRIRARSTHGLAERLIAYEAALDRTSQEGLSDTCRVCERLRRALSTLFGPDGYRILMARALILAKREAPQLVDVEVNDDGSIEGLTGKAAEVNAVLIAHFVELMETFIGETVTGVASERYLAGPARRTYQNSGKEPR
jgi:hypothetical protein